MDFKERLKWELEKKDMRVKELAQKSGVKKQTIDNYLSTHNSQPSAESAVKIARALNLSVEYLIDGKNPISSCHAETENYSTQQRRLVRQISNISDQDLKLVSALVNAILKRNVEVS